MEGKTEKPVVFSLRIPISTYRDMKTIAEKHERSVNSEIIYALKAYLKNP